MSKDKSLINSDKNIIPNHKGMSLVSKLNHSSLNVFLIDENEIIIDVNSTFLQYSNFERLSIIGQHQSVLGFTDYEGGQIFGDATIEQLGADQKVIQFITGTKTKKLAIITEVRSSFEGKIYTEILLQDVTPFMQDIEYYEHTSQSAKVGGWEFDVFNKTFRANKEVYKIHEVGLHSFFEISDPFKFYGRSVQDLMNAEFRDCIINQVPKTFECLPFYSASGKKKWVKLTFTPVVAGKTTTKIFGSLRDITEEIELKRQLEQSNKRHEDLFKFSPNPLMVIRKSDDKIIQVNNAASLFYGYSEDEFTQLSAFDIRPIKNYSDYIRSKDHSDNLRETTAQFRNVHHQHKKGHKLLVDVYRSDTIIDDELVTIVMISDVSAFQEAQERIEAINQVLATIIESSPLAIITIDVNACVELWNSTASKMFGWTREEIIGEELPYIPESKRTEFEQNLASGFEISTSQMFELERITKNGHLISIREYMTPIRNVNDTVDWFMLIIEDVTESSKTKRALVQSESKYRNLVEASKDMIWSLDHDTNFTFVNDASLEILGIEPQKLIGQPFNRLLFENDVTQCSLMHQQVINGSKFENVDLSFKDINGDEKHINATVYPSFDAEGNIVGCTGNGSDITHMIEHQRHLELMLKEKEILIKEIHHRVKNNLAVVSGLLTLQSGTQTDEATIMALTESQSRIQSIATIHEQLYQDELFTQIEMQSYLKRLTKDIGETYSHIHRNITVKVEGDEVFLNVNQAVPFGILTNELVINAFKYAFEGLPEGLITLSLKKIKDEVTFKVSDNGVGLPENFSPQSNGSLGMTLVQSLALQLGAELNYWTEKGSNFSICFTPEK